MNRTAALDPGCSVPSSSAPVDVHTNETESLFGSRFKLLLQQNRPATDAPRRQRQVLNVGTFRRCCRRDVDQSLRRPSIRYRRNDAIRRSVDCRQRILGLLTYQPTNAPFSARKPISGPITFLSKDRK